MLFKIAVDAASTPDFESIDVELLRMEASRNDSLDVTVHFTCATRYDFPCETSDCVDLSPVTSALNYADDMCVDGGGADSERTHHTFAIVGNGELVESTVKALVDRSLSVTHLSSWTDLMLFMRNRRCRVKAPVLY